MDRGTTWLSLAAAVCCVSWCASAEAGTFDERGKLVMDAAWANGFESAGEVLELSGTGFEALFDDFDERLVEDDEGLEGSSALRVGGEVRVMSVPLAQNAELEGLRGRRVELTLWYRSEGTAPHVYMLWYVAQASLDTPMEQIPRSSGYLSLQPTGRATTDGWVELSSGAFDWETPGGMEPGFLVVSDVQHDDFFEQAGFLRGHTMLLDALEITDLGPALVPDVRCDTVTEDDVCGMTGVCLLGRCMDSALVYSTPPIGENRAQYLGRRYYELDIFGAIRRGRANLQMIADTLLMLQTDSPRVFWTTLSSAYELMIDGHGSAPQFGFFGIGNPGGICLGPGVADLLPGDRRGPEPMVFSLDPGGSPISKDLRVGDVLTEVDGVPYGAWLEGNQDRFFYTGDPEGRDALVTRDLLEQLSFAGAVLTFSRCPRARGDELGACSESEVERVEVDLGRLLGDGFYAGEPTEQWDRFVSCDLRFSSPAWPRPSSGVATSNYFYAGVAQVGEVRHLLFNGFPNPASQGGSSWAANFTRAFVNQPELMILDQRTGFGGSATGVKYAASHMLGAQNDTREELVPWLGEPVTDELRSALQRCAARLDGYPGTYCGNYAQGDVLGEDNIGVGADTAIAVLSGRSVSGNDFLPQYMTYRQAPTRFFGYGPTMGAFGASCRMPSLANDRRLGYQCQDTQFVGPSSMGSPRSEFLSGKGVGPDEIVYQSQRDALDGIDSMIAAANEWLMTVKEGR